MTETDMTETDGEGSRAAVRLARMARDLLIAVGAPERFLAPWPVPQATRPAAPHPLPVLAWLDDLANAAVPPLEPVAEAVRSEAPRLAWRQTYQAADFGPEFLLRYGWTELIGRRGPIPSGTIACGILLLGPEIHYPAHAHEAEEIYLCLGGTAAWMRGEEGYTSRPPGTLIHHPSWMPHAMRTGAEPLMALYVWRGGDLAAKSKIIDPR